MSAFIDINSAMSGLEGEAYSSMNKAAAHQLKDTGYDWLKATQHYCAAAQAYKSLAAYESGGQHIIKAEQALRLASKAAKRGADLIGRAA